MQRGRNEHINTRVLAFCIFQKRCHHVLVFFFLIVNCLGPGKFRGMPHPCISTCEQVKWKQM